MSFSGSGWVSHSGFKASKRRRPHPSVGRPSHAGVSIYLSAISCWRLLSHEFSIPVYFTGRYTL